MESDKWWIRLRRSFVEFFNPRDWLPTFPITHKQDPDAQGYQTFWNALKGFQEKLDSDKKR